MVHKLLVVPLLRPSRRATEGSTSDVLNVLLVMRASLAVVLGCTACAAPAISGHFGIQAVDKATRRGVPRVKLTTTTNEVYLTDSAGQAAVPTLGIEGLGVYFKVETDGYDSHADGFGYQGATFTVTAGGNATIQVTRLQKAERLYRLTGQGIYRDSVLLGAPVPIEKPLLNAGVQGQDSILTALFGGVVHWFCEQLTHPCAHPLH